MVKVVWTEQAYEDLEAIFEYISHDSELYVRLTSICGQFLIGYQNKMTGNSVSKNSP